MKENGGTVEENLSKQLTSGCKLVLASILFAAVAVVFYHLVISPVFHEKLNQGQTSKGSAHYVQNGVVDEEVVSLFVTYDEDLDGVLDLTEFVAVANRILNRKLEGDQHLVKPSGHGFVQDWQEDNGEKLTIISQFTPLVLSTMSKYSDATSDDTGHENQLQGLKSWTNATASMVRFSVREFEAFLPDPAVTPLLAQPWYIIESRLEKGGPGLTNDRYYPPLIKGRLAIIYKLLAIFHPRPFLLTRFGPQGAVACVQAENKDYWDIVFRIHAEYQLNEPPLLPFWFTPAQFLGNIVIKKDGSHVQSFHLAVPNNRSLNVDMEWLVPEEHSHPGKETKSDKQDSEGDENMEVDIGFLPQMELQSKMPSALVNEERMDAASSSAQFQDNIKWDKHISFKEAYSALESQFYDFKKVSYLPFKDAINQARDEDKLVHHILLWGALDDQSC